MKRKLCLKFANFMNRRNVSKHLKMDVNAAEDFLEIVVTGHVLSAAMTYLGISLQYEMPSEEHFPKYIWMEDKRKGLQVFPNISAGIVDSLGSGQNRCS